MSGLKSLRIYDSVRQRILTGDLKPGVRLVVRQLAERYATSDIPVREALRMLERDGLVEIVPYCGARVIRLTAEEIREGYLIRGHLESLATRTAVGHVRAEQFAALERCMSQMEVALGNQDAGSYAELNRTFHGIIFDASPYRRLRELIENVWDGQVGYQMVFHLSPQRLHSSYSEHEALLRALREGDEEVAAAVALRHKLAVSDALVHALDVVTGEGAVGEDAAR